MLTQDKSPTTYSTGSVPNFTFTISDATLPSADGIPAKNSGASVIKAKFTVSDTKSTVAHWQSGGETPTDYITSADAAAKFTKSITCAPKKPTLSKDDSPVVHTTVFVPTPIHNSSIC
ncbi:unnamed protein product [Mesocestoides corti]|uniref:Big_5 domain-containing protein n=1 Tax=Mesocestoides corti TaxID=53468 RepID=A0A0R3UBV6_MESCO|nr:unnamed protein product [Mesocestoides corti]